MDSRHIFLFVCVSLLNFCRSISGSGCQHDCDCGFQLKDGEAQDESVTLRYEVLGGLCGAFGPLLLASLAYISYKRCCSPEAVPSFGSNSNRSIRDQTSPYLEGRHRQTRPQPFQSGQQGVPRVTTPMSLYSEMDNDMMNGTPPYAPNQVNSPGSKWMNIHRNVQADDTNMWMKNVNKIRQFH